MKLSDYVVEFIKQQGVKDIFLLPGGGCIHLIDSIGKSSLDFICNLHEQACSIAADAYGQYTNNLGVCMVTTGPGGTNAMTGLAAAWLDSTPMLVISGQVQKRDMTGNRGTRQIGFQEINMVELVNPITKYAEVVRYAEDIKYHLEKASFLARNGRPGPVWLDIPLDIQAATVDENSLRGFIPTLYDTFNSNTFIRADRLRNTVSDIIDDLNKAKRPVILAGNGIRLSGSIDKFKELTDILKIPVLLTWKAIDFMEETHPLFVGRPGGVGQRGANFSQQNSDMFISIGARLDHGQTAYQHKYFAREATKAIIDIDKNEIDKLEMDIKYPMTIDAGEFIDELILQKDKITVDSSCWLDQCKQWQKKYPVVLPKHWDTKGSVSNYSFIDALSDILPEDSLIVPGSSGGCSEVTMQALRIKKGMRVFNSEGLGPMGFGIAASIGGCVASGGKETICIDGDGGFVMNIQELETVSRLNLPIKFFVLNNDGYVSIRNTQNSHFEGNLVASGRSSGLTLPSLKKNTNAYDIPYKIIRSSEFLHDSLNEVLATPGPIVCEVILPPTHVTEPKASVYKKEDGSFMARPMEDLAPFLDRDEFKKNMIVDTVDE
tara:strand:- start:6565 stop:8376 length:1812 start_codon:yes stop_codon:yes gene_type:complete